MTNQPIVHLTHLDGADYGPVIEETLAQIAFFRTVPGGARASRCP